MAKRKRRRKRETKEEAPIEAPFEGARAWLPALTTLFVIAHLLANCLSVLPDVSAGLDRRAWRDPRVEREIAVWAERLGTERPALEEQLFSLAHRYHELRATLLAPFSPYLEAAGLQQSWLMFAAGTLKSDRFEVWTRRCPSRDRSCDWEPVYRYADPERAWRASQLDHPRLRSAIFRWGWPSYQSRYASGCEALAGLLFEERPEAREVECRFERSTLRSPAMPDPPPPERGPSYLVRRRSAR